MATANGNKISGGSTGSLYSWYSICQVTQKSSTDTSVTYTVTGKYYTKYAINVYAEGSMSGSGASDSWDGSLYSTSNSGRTVSVMSDTVTVQKGSSAKNVTFKVSIKTTGGFAPGTSTASCTVKVPAKTLRPPSAPSNLKAQRTGAGVIKLTWTKNATNATKTYIERQPYGGSWSQIASSSSVLTSYTDTVDSGTYRYRVRYWNSDGYSGYSNSSDYVTALCAPAAPTVTAPAGGATLDAADGSPVLSWRHNALDTSAQTGAQVKWTVDGWSTSHTEEVSGAESSVSIDTGSNADVQWQVRTKGAYDGDGTPEAAWSPWSAAGSFKVRTAPSVVVSVDPVLTAVPLTVSWAYDDAQGTQASATVAALDAAGNQAYSGAVQGSAASFEVPPSGFTPAQGESYTVQVTAVSTTGLQGSGSAAFTVEYTPPAAPDMAVAVDSEEHALVVSVREGSSEVPTDSISVFRDGELIASGLVDGDSCRDPLPPLDREVELRAVAYAASGAVAERTRRARVPSGGFLVVNYGEGVFKMRRNLSCPNGISHEKTARTAASMANPVMFYGPHRTRENTASAEVWTWRDPGDGKLASLKALESLESYAGNVNVRFPWGPSILASVDVSHDAGADAGNWATASIDWQEVSG